MDALGERLDRQAEAVRSMYAAYSQRETELEQLVDGLARLRAFPNPAGLERPVANWNEGQALSLSFRVRESG